MIRPTRCWYTRRLVHADGGPRRVPALGQQLGVDQHVDLAALVGRQRLGQLARRCLAGHGAGLHADRLHRRRHPLGVIDAGRVDDPRRVAEAALVEVGRRHVERVEVERGCQLALVEVAADDLDLAQRGDRAHPAAAQRSHHAAAHRLGKREVRHLGREHVADVLLQQLIGRGHADVDRLGDAADGRRSLVAQRGVRLIADDHAVDVVLQLIGVLDEPGVGVDRQRRLGGGDVPGQHRPVDPGAVPLLAEIAGELVDQQPAVGEDQDAGRPGRLHKPGGGDRLAGRGRMFEAVAAPRPRVGLAGRPLALNRVGDVGHRDVVALGLNLVLVIGSVAVAIAVGRRFLVLVVLLAALQVADQRRQLTGKRVDLMAAQRRSRCQLGLRIVQHPLQAQDQREVPAPVVARLGTAALHLLERSVECGAAGGARRQGYVGVFAFVEKRLPAPR
jgi:hypothetical protein